MHLLPLLGKSLKDDDVIDILDDMEIDVIYDFDRLHEGQPHTGWRLIAQTNNLAAGISTNLNDWMTTAGSAVTNNVTVPIDPGKPAKFYRLTYP
jgi:hypothetical protein